MQHYGSGQLCDQERVGCRVGRRTGDLDFMARLNATRVGPHAVSKSLVSLFIRQIVLKGREAYCLGAVVLTWSS